MISLAAALIALQTMYCVASAAEHSAEGRLGRGKATLAASGLGLAGLVALAKFA